MTKSDAPNKSKTAFQYSEPRFSSTTPVSEYPQSRFLKNHNRDFWSNTIRIFEELRSGFGPTGEPVFGRIGEPGFGHIGGHRFWLIGGHRFWPYWGTRFWAYWGHRFWPHSAAAPLSTPTSTPRFRSRILFTTNSTRTENRAGDFFHN